MFSKIRDNGGFNPDARCFKSAIQALLVHNQITPSSNAYCLEVQQRGSATGLLVQLQAKKGPATPDDEDEDAEDPILNVHNQIIIELSVSHH